MKTTADKRFANTLARGLSILRAFKPTDNGLGNLELSERTGIPRSTISRLTFTLCLLGYLTHGRHHDKYHLGPAALALGNIAAATFSFIEVATPIMQRIANEIGALVGIAIQDDGEMLMVKTWRPIGSPSIWFDVGYRMPILGSSTGGSFVGALSNEELDKISKLYFSEHIGKLYKFHNTNRSALLTHGFAFISGKDRFNQSINALAVPYRPSSFGEPVAILCGASSDTLPDARVWETAGPLLVNAVEELRQITGQPFPMAANDITKLFN
jgi:DNA-binding IclR family transcriptional regulator